MFIKQNDVNEILKWYIAFLTFFVFALQIIALYMSVKKKYYVISKCSRPNLDIIAPLKFTLIQ